MPINAVPRVVVHVPHSSTVIPEDIRSTFALSPEELGREIRAMTDHDTDALFALPPGVATAVRFPVSRLVIDPERFANDAEERMAPKGMGAVYTRTADGRVLRRPPSTAQRKALFARFYDPHHAALTKAVDSALESHGSCLILDTHSFPARPLPYEDDQSADRPDICLGTDAFHTAPALRDRAIGAFERAGFTVAVNRPFSGALVPMTCLRRDPRVRALMVEINRGLYMDETSGARLGAFDGVRERILGALRVVIASAESRE